MTNKVEIVVVSKNDTSAGFASARQQVEKQAKEFAEIGTKGGALAATNFDKGFSGAINGIPPQMIAALGAGALAAAPVIGATIAGAVIGAGGLGGIVGGIALVADRPEITMSAQKMGDRIENALKQSALGFVAPVLSGMDIIGASFEKNASTFRGIFDKASTWVEPLARAFDSFISNVATGFAHMMDNAGPVMDVIFTEISRLGDIIGTFFYSMGEEGEAAAGGLQYSFEALNVTLMAVFGTISVLTNLFGKLAAAGVFGYDAQVSFMGLKVSALLAAEGLEFVDGKLVKVKESSGFIGPTIADVNGSLDQMFAGLYDVANEADATSIALTNLNKALRAQTDPVFALLNAQDQLAVAQDKYTALVKEGKGETGKAQQELRKMAEAAIAMEGAAAAAGGTLDGKVSPALRATLHAAGLTDAQIDAVAGSFRDAKAAGDKFDGIYIARVQAQGASAAVSAANNAWEAAKRYAGTYTANLVTRQTFIGPISPNSPWKASGGIIGAEGGGPRSGKVWVGEQGPELVSLPTGSTVHSAGDSRRMMRENVAQAGGGGGRNVLELHSDGSDLVDLLLNLISRAVRARGGDVQTVLGKG